MDAGPREGREVPGRRVGIGRDLEKAPSPAAEWGSRYFTGPSFFSFPFLSSHPVRTSELKQPKKENFTSYHTDPATP